MSADEDPVVAACRSALLADRARGAVGPLADYQRRFPDRDDAVAAVYAELVGPAARWRRVRALFERVVELPPDEREPCLARECGDDAALRREVEGLLAAEAGGAGAGFLLPPGAATLGAALPAEPGGPRAGDRLGAYELLACIGQGGQSAVWRARDTRVGREVALKLLPAGSAWSGANLRRFRREAEITSRLEHPGICTVFDVDLDAGQPFVAMRLVRGESLAQRLARARADEAPIPPVTAARLVESAARALHAAHQVGVVHRDVKPGNLMVTPDDQVVVVDFGIARELEEQGPQLTRTGDVFGTPAYMAPEQIEGRSADPRVDVWALGVTLFELLTLDQPFREPTREALYRSILSREPSLAAFGSRVPADLRVVCATALQKEPGRRYASAGDLADDLAAFVAGRPIAARPVGPLGRLWRWARREPKAAAFAAGLLLALLLATGALGYLAAQRGRLEAGAVALAERERQELLRDLSSGVLRLNEAESRVRALLLENPRLTSTRGVLALALSSRKARAPERAMALLDAAPADQEDPRALRRVRAMVLRRLDRGDEAARIEAELGAPQSALEAYFASLAAEAAGGPDASERALAHIRRAFVLMPGPNETYLQRLLSCAFSAGDAALPGEAEQAADALVALYPDSALAWFYAGLVWTRTDLAKGRAASRRAMELDLGLPQPYVTEHLFQMQEGDFEGAAATFARGVARTEPDSEERQKLLNVRARVCLLNGRFADALDAAERACRIAETFAKQPAKDETSIAALMFKARAQRGLGDDAAAERTLRRVLELDAEHAEAKQLLGR